MVLYRNECVRVSSASAWSFYCIQGTLHGIPFGHGQLLDHFSTIPNTARIGSKVLYFDYLV